MFLIEITPGTSPEIMGIVRQASDEVRRIETLTRSTLGFFRQSAGPEKVDLETSAESVRLLLEPLTRKRGIELEFSATGDCLVHAFPVETRQVLLNLVRNACEATPQNGPKVRVILSGKPDVVEIVVADEGAGIASSMLPNLFQFGASTKGERGNGMGLWVVKQLIEKHGGTIHLETGVGRGTRFTILWPREFPAPPPVPGALTSSAQHSAK
jgi:signal transduction histidine kinase